MATRKTATKLDPVAVTAVALKQIKCAADYRTVAEVTDSDTLNEAWQRLSEIDRNRLEEIIKNAVRPSPLTLANELAACGTRAQLQAIKSGCGDLAVKAAWRLLSALDRSRLTSICQNEPQEELEPVTETPTIYKVETQTSRSLFNISDDLQRLNDLLDEVGDDAQQQELISQWFETLGNERDRKLDSYAALISEMQARAEVRKAEAKRMQELAATDENRAKFLKDRLKSFFQLHDIRTIETPRYKLSLAKNGGKLPLVLDEDIPVTTLPEQFQRISIDPDTTAIRSALDAGEILSFARFGERGENLRIK